MTDTVIPDESFEIQPPTCFTDKRTQQASAALLLFSETTLDPNDRMSAFIFHDYLENTDMSFEELLRNGSLAAITARAMTTYEAPPGEDLAIANNVRHQLGEQFNIKMTFQQGPAQGEQKQDQEE